MLLELPGQIGPLRLKNRVVMAPMGTNFSTTDGLATERDKFYYAERARGGVAMIMTEAMVVTAHARPHHNSLCCYHDRFIPGLAGIVEAIKAHGCHVVGQLNHRGALLRRAVLNMEPVGPSPWTNPNTGEAVRPLSVAEIIEIERFFVAAARRLWQAGYDGVELHAGNGYLFQQFFTPRINRRTDNYGGSLENRMRFLLETVARVRDALPELLLTIRLSASEFAAGGYSQDEIIELARALERAGVAALDLSGGSNESPQLSKYCIQPPSFPRGCLAPHAKPIKAAVAIPVLVAGRIVEPADAEAVLASHSADFISLGRALYADAHWCLKAFGKIRAPIRQCIACNVCFERLTLEKDVSCVQNPLVGTDFEALEHAEPQLFAARARQAQIKRVLVIGAGVSGIETARIVAGCGHHVEVWEKRARAGGQMPLAMAAPDKREIEPVWSYRWQELEELAVTVRTGVAVNADLIRAYRPDLVVVATGAVPLAAPFDLSGLQPRIKILQAWDFLGAPDAVERGSRVTIVGGGMVGLETADLLATRNCAITIVEMLPMVAPGMARNNKMDLLERLQSARVRILLGARIQQAAGDALEVATADSGTECIAIGDYLVIAIGPAPGREVVAAVEEAGAQYVLVGDCAEPGDFLSCVRDAWMVGLSVDNRFRRTRDEAGDTVRSVSWN